MENDADKGDSKANTKPEHKAKEIRNKWRPKTLLDVLIYICGVLVVIGGLWLGYLGVSGHLQSNKVLGLWVLYATLFFVLTGAFLYFQKLIWEEEAKAAKSKQSQTLLSATDRPYVGIGSFNVRGIAVGQSPTLSVIYENSGKTPALEFISQAFIIIYRGELPAVVPLPEFPNKPSIGTLNPGKSDEQVVEDNRVVITADQMNRIERGASVVYVYATGQYKDSGGGEYSFEYCYRLIPSSGKFFLCPYHNSSN